MRKIVILFVVFLLTISAASAKVETGFTGANECRNPTDGHIDFENGVDKAVIVSQIPGIQFTGSGGYDWVYSEATNGQYNYPSYWAIDNFVAWCGSTQNWGRIDFTKGDASYFSALVATYSGVQIDAYDSNDVLIATSGVAGNNLDTRTMTRLTVETPTPQIAYVIIHDTGNYWIADEMCTDAPGVNPIPSPEFPSVLLPATMIIGMLGAVLFIQRTREN